VKPKMLSSVFRLTIKMSNIFPDFVRLFSTSGQNDAAHRAFRQSMDLQLQQSNHRPGKYIFFGLILDNQIKTNQLKCLVEKYFWFVQIKSQSEKNTFLSLFSIQFWAWSKEVFYFEIKSPGLHENPPQTRKKLLTVYSYTILRHFLMFTKYFLRGILMINWWL